MTMRFVTALLFATFMSTAAMAEGAVAVGDTGNFNRDGWSIGYAWNYDDVEEAKKAALEDCRDSEIKSARACKIVATFRNQWFAYAEVPDSTSPGVGWGVGNTQAGAEATALKMCRQRAGRAASRCIVDESVRDVTN